jgi:O-succinylbenzoic acid--CoA ligase
MLGNFLTPENLLTYLKQRTHQDWLISYESDRFYELTEKRLVQLTRFSKSNHSFKVFLAEENPYKFLAYFLAAIATKCHLFLCNPDWKQQEWQQVFELVKPDLILGKISFFTDRLSLEITSKTTLDDQEAKIMIPTGGTSGRIRFAIHNWETLTASVKGFIQYFAIAPVNSFCVLPLYHVSGLMQFLRSFLTEGCFLFYSYKSLKSKRKPHINPTTFFISLVPTQLDFLLKSDSIWLSQFYTVLLGGSPAWESLLNTARKYRIKLAPTYGMTETAAQVITLKPEDFLVGNNSNGRVLPHAKIRIHRDEYELLKLEETGLIAIESDSLFLGYYPELHRDRTLFKTDDLGYFDRQGYLYVIGRNSQKIITGGENVFPAEIEAAILATQLVTDVAVIGVPDTKWGQAVTAVYVPKQEKINAAAIALALQDKISRFKQPKHWIPVESLPRNQQGKINYKQLREIASDGF